MPKGGPFCFTVKFKQFPLLVGGCFMLFGEWIIKKFAIRIVEVSQ
jgi:hypothetical protein